MNASGDGTEATPDIARIGEEDLPRLLELNNAHAEALSRLDLSGLATLARRSFHARAAGAGQALLLTFDQDADYGSPNFLWFKRRYPRFVYIDRVVVSPTARGQGLARILYQDLFAAAAAAGHGVVTCEVNLIPANPGSDAFHARLGFAEVGRGELSAGAKLVRYLARPLPSPATP